MKLGALTKTPRYSIANIEAGADLIGEAAAEEATDIGVLGGVNAGGAVIADGSEDDTPAMPDFNKGVEVFEGEADRQRPR